jgi:HEAT repeat protein
MGNATRTTEYPGFERCVEFIRSQDSAVMEEGFAWLESHAAEHTVELITLVEGEADPYVRGMFVELLGATRDARAIAALAGELRHHDRQVREWAVFALEDLGLPEAAEMAARHRAEHPDEWGPAD